VSSFSQIKLGDQKKTAYSKEYRMFGIFPGRTEGKKKPKMVKN